MHAPELDYSIIVPLYNQEPYIEGCVRALTAIDYPEDRFEIIVVDNNSTDRSVEIVKDFPRVRLLHEARQGDFAARNAGLRASRGRVLAFTDADTAPATDWLTSIGRVLEDEQIEVIIGYLCLGEGGRVLSMLEAYEAQRGDFVFSSDDPEIYYGYTCNQIVRRRAFDRLGAFPDVFRNSDTVFVRKVVDEMGCGAVAYSREVRVQRLEVATLAQFMLKQHTYGRDYRRYRQSASVRALGGRERLRLFRDTFRQEGYNPLESGVLLCALGTGALAYELGRLRG